MLLFCFLWKQYVVGGVVVRLLSDLDRVDRKILKLLQQQGRISNVELSQQVNLSPTPCLERVRRLEKEGFITHYVAIADPVKLGLGLSAYITVTLNNTATQDLQAFSQQMLALEEVQECHMVAGGFDYLIRIRVPDMLGYQHFLGEKLAAIPLVSQTHTYVVIEEVKSETALAVSV